MSYGEIAEVLDSARKDRITDAVNMVTVPLYKETERRDWVQPSWISTFSWKQTFIFANVLRSPKGRLAIKTLGADAYGHHSTRL